MNEIIAILAQNPYFNIVTGVIALASAITSVTPTPALGSKLGKVYKVIDFLALNVGKAKQTGKPKVKK